MRLEGSERVAFEGGGGWSAVPLSTRRQTSQATHNISAAKRRSPLSMLWRPAAVINNGNCAKLSPTSEPHRRLRAISNLRLSTPPVGASYATCTKSQIFFHELWEWRVATLRRVQKIVQSFEIAGDNRLKVYEIRRNLDLHETVDFEVCTIFRSLNLLLNRESIVTHKR